MTESPRDNFDHPEFNEAWETRLHKLAQNFPYPPTPDIAGVVRPHLAPSPRQARPVYLRRLAWAVGLVLLLAAGLLAVPQVRAAVLEFLQVGAIRIFLTSPTPTVTPFPITPSPAARVSPTPNLIVSVLELAGETTLAEAQDQIDFPIRLPAYPPDLGHPQRVFLQDMAGPVVVLAWLDPDQPERVRLSLHELGPGTFAQKGQPRLIRETIVHGRPAYWMEGPYILQIRRGNQAEYDLRRLVEGQVLVWVEGEITYRLETRLPLEEAVKIAESLRP